MTTPTPEQLHHLANRARDGVALPAEHDALANGITAMAAQVEQAKADHAALLKGTVTLITSIGYARHALAINILGQPGTSDDMSLDQLVVHAVAEYRAAEAAMERVRQLHRKASHGETCVYCAHGQRLGYDTTWPCDTIRTLDQAQQPTTTEALHDEDGNPICTCTHGERCPTCRAEQQPTS